MVVFSKVEFFIQKIITVVSYKCLSFVLRKTKLIMVHFTMHVPEIENLQVVSFYRCEIQNTCIIFELFTIGMRL